MGDFEILPDEPQLDRAVDLALDGVARSRYTSQEKADQNARIQDNHRPQFRYLGEIRGQSVIQAAGGSAFLAGERITNGSMESGAIAPSYTAAGVVRLGGMPRVLGGGERRSQTVQAGVLVLRSTFVRIDTSVVTTDPIPARIRVAYGIDAVGSYRQDFPNGDFILYDTYGPGVNPQKPWSITGEPRYFGPSTPFWYFGPNQCWLGRDNWGSAPPGDLLYQLGSPSTSDTAYGYYAEAFYGGMVIFTELDEGEPLPPLPKPGEVINGACTYPPVSYPEAVWSTLDDWGFLEAIVVSPGIPAKTEIFKIPIYAWDLLLVGATPDPVVVMSLEPEQVDGLWARMAIDASGIHVDVKLGYMGAGWDELRHYTITGNNVAEIDESTNWRRLLANSLTTEPIEEPENKCIEAWLNQAALNIDESQSSVFYLLDQTDEDKQGLDVVTLDDLKKGTTRTITQKIMQYDDSYCLVDNETPIVESKTIALAPYDPELRTGEVMGEVTINESAQVLGFAGYISPIRITRTE